MSEKRELVFLEEYNLEVHSKKQLKYVIELSEKRELVFLEEYNLEVHSKKQ